MAFVRDVLGKPYTVAATLILTTLLGLPSISLPISATGLFG